MTPQLQWRNLQEKNHSGWGEREEILEMNILFLTLIDFETLEERNIYTDLLREFVKNNHHVYVVSPTERRKGKKTYLVSNPNTVILKLKIGNIQKTNFIEKGISTVTLESKYVRGISKYFGNVKFDLVLYTTPPITLLKAVQYVKKRDGAKTYLMLKDIFPQNAVDMGMLSKRGCKGILYRYFRNKEKKLYQESDYIGCMSPANVEYVKKHNSDILPDKVELCPNSIEPTASFLTEEEKVHLKKKYGIPENKRVFIYGGNLGRPQGIEHMMQCIQSVTEKDDCYFLIIGSGTEYDKIRNFIDVNHLTNVGLYEHLPKADYEKVVRVCDVGLLFLDYRFTIPNFPSRALTYMDAGIPVLAVTDEVSDIGKIIEENAFGYRVKSNDISAFKEVVCRLLKSEEISTMGRNAHKYLEKEYTVQKVYKDIMKHFVN